MTYNMASFWQLINNGCSEDEARSVATKQYDDDYQEFMNEQYVRDEVAWVAFLNKQIDDEAQICDDLQRTYDEDNDDDDEQLTDGE